MDDRPERVWKAIEDGLQQYGDSDIRAGLAWIKDEDKIKIAEAAIEAASIRPGPSGINR